MEALHEPRMSYVGSLAHCCPFVLRFPQVPALLAFEDAAIHKNEMKTPRFDLRTIYTLPEVVVKGNDIRPNWGEGCGVTHISLQQLA